LGEVPLRLWLEVRFEARPGGGAVVAVFGWCVAVQPLKSVELTVGGRKVRLPIWIPRMDVEKAVNADGIYPNLHALCCGIAGEVALTDAPRVPLAADVAAVGVEGGRLSLATVTAAPDGTAQQVLISLRAGDRCTNAHPGNGACHLSSDFRANGARTNSRILRYGMPPNQSGRKSCARTKWGDNAREWSAAPGSARTRTRCLTGNWRHRPIR
jgi:hypothetical protein